MTATRSPLISPSLTSTISMGSDKTLDRTRVQLHTDTLNGPLNENYAGTGSTYDQLDHMERLIGEYSHSTLGPPVPPRRRDRPVTSSILLTGSTGNLGSDILALLLHDPSVKTIYALNRRSSQGPPSERVLAQFTAKGLDVAALKSEKLVFIEGDTTQHDLGLERSIYSEICASISMIVHNAWSINLQQDLPFFLPNLIGLRNLINLGHASSSASALRFVFISSVHAAQSWNDSRPVPEEVLMDTAVGCGLGYGASKYVAERIVARSGLDATSLRVGQLCGRSFSGQWSPSEWVPIIVNAGITVGTLPVLSGVMPFIPLDVAAKCIHEVVSSAQPLPDVLNFSHPRPSPWILLNDAVNYVISTQTGHYPLPSIPLSEWALNIEQSVRLRQGQHPMTKLLPGLRVLALHNEDILQKGTQETDYLPRPRLGTNLAQDYSLTLRNLQQLSPADAERWVKYWMSLKFFQTASLQAGISPKL